MEKSRPAMPGTDGGHEKFGSIIEVIPAISDTVPFSCLSCLGVVDCVVEHVLSVRVT